MNSKRIARIAAATVIAALATMPRASAQPPALPQAGRGGRGPVVISPEVQADRHITFRILAANAQSVRVAGGDIPALAAGRGGRGVQGDPPPPPRGEMTKGENGVWEITLGPIDA